MPARPSKPTSTTSRTSRSWERATRPDRRPCSWPIVVRAARYTCSSAAPWDPRCRSTWQAASGPRPTSSFTSRPKSNPSAETAGSARLCCERIPAGPQRACPVRRYSFSSAPTRRPTGCLPGSPATPRVFCSLGPRSLVRDYGPSPTGIRVRWRRRSPAYWPPATSAAARRSAWGSPSATVRWPSVAHRLLSIGR